MADIVPYGRGSAVQQWYRRATGNRAIRKASDSTAEAILGVKQLGEGAFVGALLGYLHVNLKTGLDIKVAGKTVPVDGAMAIAGPVAAAIMSDGIVSEIIRNNSGNAATVYAFRMTYGLLAEKKLAQGQQPGGQFGPMQKAKIEGEPDWGAEYGGSGSPDYGAMEDPILAAARGL